MTMPDHASILPLRVEGISFAAQGKALLADVSFTLQCGGITAVIGPNGAGKSLLLRICHGLLPPGEGRLRWATPEGLVEGRKRHAMVFQRPVMLRRSSRANISHALVAAHWPRDDRAARADAALDRFGLQELAERPARLLSGGEQQRLAIARAWALAPDVIFLDEPCSQLDPGATRQIEAMLSELERDGVTLLMATHDLPQALRLAKNLLFLHRGHLLENRPAQAFFAAPETAEGRAFIAGELLW